MDIIDIARVCHEVNRAYCKGIGDAPHEAWDNAPDWQRQSAIAGVRFLAENPAAGPDASHKAWLAHKEAEGWKFGYVKDEAKKEHPCFVPYEQLPAEQRVKDYLFQAVTRTLLAMQAEEVSTTAKEAMRVFFNPSQLDEVGRIKYAAARLFTLLEKLWEKGDRAAAREASIAMTHAQAASMWGVMGATKNL